MNKFYTLLLAAALILAASSVSGKIYVDWNGEYYIEYPDEWSEVPYRAVDIFLVSQNISPLEFSYSVVISEESGQPYFSNAYLFISAYPIGEFSGREIDSILKVMSDSYESQYIKGSLADTVRRFRPGQPVYDEKQKVIAVFDHITGAVTDKVLLELRKFYEKGVVIFYCYAPIQKFDSVRPKFLSILNSFSIENLDRFSKSSDSVKIVDLSERQPAEYEDTRPEPHSGGNTTDRFSGSAFKIILAIAILIALIYTIAKNKRRKQV